MQRKEIKRGELLAHRNGNSGPYRAAIVLDTSTLWQHSTGRRADASKWAPTKDTRPGRSAGYDLYTSHYWGLLAVLAETTYDATERDRYADVLTYWIESLADPHTLTPDTVADLAKSTPAGTKLTVIEPRHLHGRWRPTIAAYDRAVRIESERREGERVERERLRGVYDRALAAWQARFGADSGFNYDPYTESTMNARVSLEQLADLLGVDTDPK